MSLPSSCCVRVLDLRLSTVEVPIEFVFAGQSRPCWLCVNCEGFRLPEFPPRSFGPTVAFLQIVDHRVSELPPNLPYSMTKLKIVLAIDNHDRRVDQKLNIQLNVEQKFDQPRAQEANTPSIFQACACSILKGN